MFLTIFQLHRMSFPGISTQTAACNIYNISSYISLIDDLAVSATNQNGVFYPCVAFRIVGTPSKYMQSKYLYAREYYNKIHLITQL